MNIKGNLSENRNTLLTPLNNEIFYNNSVKCVCICISCHIHTFILTNFLYKNYSENFELLKVKLHLLSIHWNNKKNMLLYNNQNYCFSVFVIIV